MAEFSNTRDEEADFQAFMRNFASPSTPTQAFGRSEMLRQRLSDLDPVRAAQVLGGLMTEPRFQANTIRLDFLLRLVLSFSSGRVKLRSQELNRLLNEALVEAGVATAEDPPEDFFVRNVAIRGGEFRVIPGQFEKASTHTTALIDAFTSTKPTQVRRRALIGALALLRLSDEICSRARLDRNHAGSGSPAGEIKTPADERLRTLAKQVFFSQQDLKRIDVSYAELAPFLLRPEEAASIANETQGNAAIDRRPLIRVPDGVIVAAPQSISTAVRAHLIDSAMEEGTADNLALELLNAQARMVDDSSFAKLEGVPVQRHGGVSFRTYVEEISDGRFVHVIQTSDDFSGWPERSFGSETECDAEFMSALIGTIKNVRKEFTERVGFKMGLTLWIMGGWGSARGAALDLSEGAGAWNFLAIEAEDAATFGMTEGGKIEDLWRLTILTNQVEAFGFQLSEVNGPLNLFQWWRDNDYALVPPEEIELAPPMFINLGTDHLIVPRYEAIVAEDRHARQHPEYAWLVVSRIERREFSGSLRPAYASMDALRSQELLGVVAHEDASWWIECISSRDDNRLEAYETWNAAINWLVRILPVFASEFGKRVQSQNLHFRIYIEDRVEELPPSPLSDDAIRASVTISLSDHPWKFDVLISSEWHWGMHRPDNIAELQLAVAFLKGACQFAGISLEQAALEGLALRGVGSSDFRYRHSLEVFRVVDAMRGTGLIPDLQTLSRSAGSLAKFGTAWSVRKPSDPRLIEGKAECVALITSCVEAELKAFIKRLRLLDRRALVTAALSAMQAALADMRNWETTARAMRAIHGAEKDLQASLDHISNANGVLRTSTIIAEVAACEAAIQDGYGVGQMDLTELQAFAALIFQQADLVPAFYSDRLEPIVRISPTGDLLIDHEFHDVTLRGSLEIVQKRQREDASEEYVARFARTEPTSDVDLSFNEALVAEYGVPNDVFREFASATASLAREDQTDVLLIRRSELLGRLAASSLYGGLNFEPLVDRLILPNRSNWDEVPAGSRKNDYDFSRFDRRFSLIGRPLLALSNDQDQLLGIAPAIIERAVVHNVGGARSGNLQNEFWVSAEMQRYASARGGVEGLEFNATVAEALGRLGMEAWDSAKPAWCLNLQKTPEVVQLGDLDALAISPNRKHVWVVEAKDLKLCRTLGETSRRLSEYRGVTDHRGRPDALLRHLRRVEFLRKHADRLVSRLNLPKTPLVHGIIAVRAPQPMAQLKREYAADALVVMLDDLASVPWDEGW